MERELTLDVSADALWDAVRRPDALATWLGEDAHFEQADPDKTHGDENHGDENQRDQVSPGVAGRVYDQDGWRRLVVTQVGNRPDGARRLAFVWWPEDDAEAVSRVELVVIATPGGSRLVVHETFASMLRSGAIEPTDRLWRWVAGWRGVGTPVRC